jgi:hypothetical protein
MCGIIVKSNPLTFEELISIFDSDRFLQRGEHGFGLLMINTETGIYEVDKFCEPDESDMMELIYQSKKRYEEIKVKYNMFIYHNRWASVGGKNIKLTHPVESEDWIVVHNGTKAGADILSSASDTEGFAKYILSSPKIRDEFLEDCGVLFGYNKENKKLYFHKDKSRSLWYNHLHKIFASEPLKKTFGVDGWGIISDKAFGLFEEIEYVDNDIVKQVLKAEDSDKSTCDICSKRSANKIKIEDTHICYNCITAEGLPKKYVSKYVYDAAYDERYYTNQYLRK